MKPVMQHPPPLNFRPSVAALQRKPYPEPATNGLWRED
jgi:hypothetical protein